MRATLTAAFALMATTALAAGEACIKVDADLDRLACYDKELGRSPTTTPVPTPVETAWQSTETTSQMTDDKTVMLQVDSEEVINCGWNNGAKVSLLLMCREKKTALAFSTGCHMASSDYDSYGDIEYRLDTEKAKKVSATASTDNRALGLWSGGKSIPVIKQMIGKSKMIARMTPFSESRFTATFNIAGLDTVIKPLREACGW